MQRVILHLDMNSYFASVEQQANPFLRNKPLGVCAYLSKNGCLVATSKDAKKFGVVTGLRVPEALSLCPRLILVENDPNKYRAVSERVFKLMAEYSEQMEIYSIDEAFLDLTDSVKCSGVITDDSYQKALALAKQIQIRIKEEIGDYLTCSVGISFTKFLAKFASDTAGSGAIQIIPNVNSLDSLYEQTPIIKAWGIGPAWAKDLNQLGIITLLDLKNYPVDKLLSRFSKSGYFLWAKINGLDVDNLADGADAYAAKSIGHSYCLPKPTASKQELLDIFSKLAFKITSHLRDSRSTASGIRIFWSYLGAAHNRQTFSYSKTLPSAIILFSDLFLLIENVIKKQELPGKVLMLGVSVFKLLPYSKQATIFESHANAVKILQEAVVEDLNNRFGNLTIYPGRLFSVKNSAPDRIGFRKSVKI